MVNILFCGNGKVLDGVITTTLSAMMRTDNPEPFHIYVMTMDITRIKPVYTAITDTDIEYLNEVFKKYNKDNVVTKIDVTNLYEKEFAYCPNEGAYCSPYTLLRLLADLVPDMPEKLLYLDIDIMFNRDIHLLYDKDLTGYEYATKHLGLQITIFFF